MASSSPADSSTTFERAFAIPEAANNAPSPQPISRRNSEIQHEPAASLDVPYQPQSASWEAVNSSGFPYTPSYRDSFTPYGSDSGLSWTGRDSGQNQIFEEPSDNHEVEYNPADFDGPNSQSNVTSPYFLDGEQAMTRPGMGSDYLTSNGYGGDSTLSQHNRLSPRARSYSTDTNKSYSAAGTPHARMNSLDVNSFSPRPLSAASPASSVGGLDIDRPRSRASSVSSVHQATPSPAVGPIGEALDKLGFDSVDSDLLWRNQQQQHQPQQPGQGVAKAQSPPQLLIPSETPSSTLQIPSFGNPQASLGAGLNTGGLGLSAPGINILPATPVSGGAGASNVPFDQVLKNLNDRRQQQQQQQPSQAARSNDESMHIMASHG